jgi:CBS domain containing-hemolysin-like protein
MYVLQVGIITLEDLLEEILQQEIYDEKDINPNSSRKMKKHHMAAGGGAMSGVCVCVCARATNT